MRRDSRPSALAGDARGTERDDGKHWRCVLCGQVCPGTRQASTAASQRSSAPDDGFRPCVQCGGAREPQRAAARAHEVRLRWRLPQPPAQPVFTALQEFTADEVARVSSSPGPSTPPPPAAPADQAGRGQDAPQRRAMQYDRADARQARRLEAAEGTLVVMAAMAALRRTNAASAKPPETTNLPRHETSEKSSAA